MLRDRKVLIGILGIVAVCIIVGIIILIPKGKKYKETVFLGSNTRVTVKNGNISMSLDDVKVKKQNVKIYDSGKIVDGYVVTEKEDSTGLKNNLHAYTEDDKIILSDPALIAYTKDISLNIIPTNSEFVIDLASMVKPILKSNIDISTVNPDYFIVNYLDVDSDGLEEKIYSMGLVYESTKYVSLVVMEKDNNYYQIIREQTSSDEDEKVSYSFVELIDFNNDGNYEYIINKNMGEGTPSIFEIYNFDGTTFNKLNVY